MDPAFFFPLLHIHCPYVEHSKTNIVDAKCVVGKQRRMVKGLHRSSMCVYFMFEFVLDDFVKKLKNIS